MRFEIGGRARAMLTGWRALPKMLTVGCVLLFGRLAPPPCAGAQGQDLSVSDSLAQLHTLHVSPHLLVLDPRTKAATLELSNAGATPLDGDVVAEYGYTTWPDTDLTGPEHAANGHWSNPHDTVIRAPQPGDRSAAAWFPGLPLHVRLRPHETRRLTVRIVPPSELPAGEYAARIVTRVQPPRPRGATRDTRTRYALPVTGPLVLLRDSVRVFYRQGPLRLGLNVQRPTTGIGHKLPYEVELQDDWVRLPVHLTGNMHFEGEVKHFFRNAQGEVVQQLITEEITITHDGVIRHWCDVPARSRIPSGHYVMVWTFEATQREFPASRRIPMTPVTIEIPVDIP